jgi:hypothetical protein
MSLRVDRLALLVVTALVGTTQGVAGCAAPCAIDADCVDGQYCGGEGESRLCTTDCQSLSDCTFGETCSARGRCEAADGAVVTWLSPAEGASVDEAFDVELEIRFVGREAVVRLTLPADEAGSPCGGFAPATIRLPGVTTQESKQAITIPDVRAAGADFGLQIEVVVDEGEPRFARRTFRGPTLPEPLGIEVTSPEPGDVPLLGSAPTPLSTAIDLTIGFTSSEIWGRVIPTIGAPTPMRVLASDTNALRGIRHALALGPQTLELTFAQGGTPSVCRLALDATPVDVHPIEVGLTFTGPDDSDLDLWLYAETDDGDSTICTPQGASSPCLGAYVRPGVLEFGEESAGLALEDGLYGIAVVPGAASEPVSALLRLSRDGAHQAFVGPFTMSPGLGEVWLAARLYVVNGVLSVEPMYQIVSGAPAGGPETW